MTDDNTRPISVAELLARNGAIGSPPVSGHRRRKRRNAVSVADLTGEIPVVSAEEAAPAPECAESSETVVVESSVTETETVESPDSSETAENTVDAEYAETPENAAEAEYAETPENAAGAEDTGTTDYTDAPDYTPDYTDSAAAEPDGNPAPEVVEEYPDVAETPEAVAATEDVEYSEGDSDDEGVEYSEGDSDDEVVEYSEGDSDDEVVEYSEGDSDDEVVEYSEGDSDDEVVEYSEGDSDSEVVEYSDTVETVERSESVEDTEVPAARPVVTAPPRSGFPLPRRRRGPQRSHDPRPQRRSSGAEQMTYDPVDEAVELSELVAEQPEPAEELRSYLRSSTGTLFSGETVADDLARRGLVSEPDDSGDEDGDEDYASADVAAPRRSALSMVGNSVIAVLQSLLAVVFGAGLFIAFDQLWRWNNIVALALSTLVIVALVVGVHLVRKTEDFVSILIAVAVGILVTFGPLALQST